MPKPGTACSRKFLIELIKPSHYDDNGYVIQWWRGFLPSNSLATLYGLALDAQQRRILGDDVEIAIEAFDETTQVIPVRRIIRQFRRNGTCGLVCLVGVQTNQFARALDLSRRFLAEGIKVAIGGFHVSGCSSMLPEMTSEAERSSGARDYFICGRGRGPVRRIAARCARQSVGAHV